MEFVGMRLPQKGGDAKALAEPGLPEGRGDKEQAQISGGISLASVALGASYLLLALGPPPHPALSPGLANCLLTPRAPPLQGGLEVGREWKLAWSWELWTDGTGEWGKPRSPGQRS